MWVLRSGQHEEAVLLHSSPMKRIRALIMKRVSPRDRVGAAVMRDYIHNKRVCEQQPTPR